MNNDMKAQTDVQATPEASQAETQRSLAEIQRNQVQMQASLASLTRICSQNFNRLHGSGAGLSYTIVPFLDGTLPTSAIPAGGPLPPRPALPAIKDVHVIFHLGDGDLSAYVRGYYGPNAVVPHALHDRRVLVADAIGCPLPV